MKSFKCPYDNIECVYIDTSGMSQMKECPECEHYNNGIRLTGATSIIVLEGKEESLPQERGFYEAEFNGRLKKIYYNSTSEASKEIWLNNVTWYYI